MITLLHGDAREMLQTLPAGSVQCIVTSPPYYGLRKYSDDPREIGQETTPAEYVAALVEVFRQARRVLRDDGVLWLNLGDSYASSGGAGGAMAATGLGSPARAAMPRPEASDPAAHGRWNRDWGLPDKNLIGIPWRVAFALQDDGWILRSDVVWNKPNCMPESVTDRPTRAHEYVFLFAKSARYFYDAAAIAEPSTGQMGSAADFKRATKESLVPGQSRVQHRAEREPTADTGTRNKRTVWTIADPEDERAAFGLYLANLAQRLIDAGVDSATISAAMRHAEADNLAAYANKTTTWRISTQSYSGAHYATMPEALIAPCILAGSSAQACETCGAAWGRVVERSPGMQRDRTEDEGLPESMNAHGIRKLSGKAHAEYKAMNPDRDLGFAPRCACAVNTGSARSVVLDPFGGSGTVAKVATRYQRDAVLIELNQAYIDDHIETRTDGVQVELFV